MGLPLADNWGKQKKRLAAASQHIKLIKYEKNHYYTKAPDPRKENAPVARLPTAPDARHVFTIAEPVSPQNLYTVPYAFDLLLKPYIKLTT